MRYIENIVIGKPIVDFSHLCCSTHPAPPEELEEEQNKTYFTNERNLAKIFKELGIVKSLNEVRRNKPKLCNDLTELNCMWIKWGKRKFWVIVGKEDG